LISQRRQRVRGHVPAVLFALSFVVQLVVVPAAIEWSSLALGEYAKTSALPYLWLDYPVRFLQTALPDFLGFLFGYLLRHFPPVVREPARWIWIVPASLFLALFVASLFVDLSGLLYALFGIRSSGYVGDTVIALVFPAMGFCLYSVGIQTGDTYVSHLVDVERDYDS
jgi:hypothetical protein